MERGYVLLTSSAVVRSLRPLSCPVVLLGGGAVAGSCASSIVPIVGESVSVDPVIEPMRSLEGPLRSGSTPSCVAPSETSFLSVSESIVVIRDIAEVAMQTDGWLQKFEENMSKPEY